MKPNEKKECVGCDCEITAQTESPDEDLCDICYYKIFMMEAMDAEHAGMVD